jgi:hypothetical protein
MVGDDHRRQPTMTIIIYRRSDSGTLSTEHRDSEDGRAYEVVGDTEYIAGWPTSAMRQAVIDGAEIPDVYLGTTLDGRLADTEALTGDRWWWRTNRARAR